MRVHGFQGGKRNGMIGKAFDSSFGRAPAPLDTGAESTSIHLGMGGSISLKAAND